MPEQNAALVGHLTERDYDAVKFIEQRGPIITNVFGAQSFECEHYEEIYLQKRQSHVWQHLEVNKRTER